MPIGGVGRKFGKNKKNKSRVGLTTAARSPPVAGRANQDVNVLLSASFDGEASEDEDEQETGPSDPTSTRPRQVQTSLRRRSFDETTQKTKKVEGGQRDSGGYVYDKEDGDPEGTPPTSPRSGDEEDDVFGVLSNDPKNKNLSAYDKARNLHRNQDQVLARFERVPVVGMFIKAPRAMWRGIQNELDDLKQEKQDQEDNRGRSIWVGPRHLKPALHDLKEEYVVRRGGYDRSYEVNVHPCIRIDERKLKVDASVPGMSIFGKLKGGDKKKSLQKAPKAAVKIIQLMGVQQSIRIESRKRMIKNLSDAFNVEHENLMNVQAVFVEDTRVSVVIDRMPGGSVLDVITTKTRLSEYSVRSIVQHVASALAAVHTAGLPHGGVKPSNILLPERIGTGGIKDAKLADLGMTPAGAPRSHYYECPEALKRRLGITNETPRVGTAGHEPTGDGDIWALGVCTYEMLCGYPPFAGGTEEEVYRQIMDEGLRFTSADWRNVSSECKLLVRRMLSVDPLKRPGAWEVGTDRWMDAAIEEENEREVGVSKQGGGVGRKKRVAAWKKGVHRVANADRALKVEEMRRTAGRVGASEEFCAVVSNGGALLTWGHCTNGELAVGEMEDRVVVPRPVDTGGRQILQVALGAHHMVCLASSGEVLTCGSNASGELGHGDRKERVRLSPVSVLSKKKVALVAAGAAHSAAVLQGGSLYTWGSNVHGRLGLGNTEDKNLPVIVESIETRSRLGLSMGQRDGFGKVALVYLGVFHSVAVMQNGAVLAWGSNHHGQCGLGENVTEIHLPEEVNLDSAMPGQEVVAVAGAAGFSHTLLLTSSGGVLGAGENSDGRCGLGHNRRASIFEACTIGDEQEVAVVAVAAGAEHSVVCTSSGTVLACGGNTLGQLGTSGPDAEDERNVFAPVDWADSDNAIISTVACGAFNTLAYEAEGDGGLFSWGSSDPPEVLGQTALNDLQRLRAAYQREEAERLAENPNGPRPPTRTAKGNVMSLDIEALGVESMGPGRVLLPDEIMKS